MTKSQPKNGFGRLVGCLLYYLFVSQRRFNLVTKRSSASEGASLRTSQRTVLAVCCTNLYGGSCSSKYSQNIVQVRLSINLGILIIDVQRGLGAVGQDCYRLYLG